MRLLQVERGDGVFHRFLIRFISMVSGMRLPDAARIVLYHQDFYGKPMTLWTHAAMRGQSSWSVGERELIAAMIAKWNTCPFCVDAHGSIAALELGTPLVKSTLSDFQHTNISVKLKETLVFLKKLIQSPDNLSIEDVRIVLRNDVTSEALEDAIAIAVLFSITARCANAFDFALLNGRDSIQAAKRMLKQGYVFGKGKNSERPDHRAMADALRKRIFEGPGIADEALRQAVAKRAAGDDIPLEAPYDELASLTGGTSYKITDELVRQVVTKSGSEKAAFELMTTAAVGVGLHCWDRGAGLLKEAI